RRLNEEPSAIERDPRAEKYLVALRGSHFVRDLLAGQTALQWSPATLVSDDPRKGLGLASREQLLLPRLFAILGEPTVSIDLVSPYFVPTDAGVEAFTQLAA